MSIAHQTHDQATALLSLANSDDGQREDAIRILEDRVVEAYCALLHLRDANKAAARHGILMKDVDENVIDISDLGFSEIEDAAKAVNDGRIECEG